MFSSLGIILVSVIFSATADEPQAIHYNWTASLGHGLQEEATQLTRFSDGGLAAAYFQKQNDTAEKYQFTIQAFDKSGRTQKICRPEVNSVLPLGDRVNSFTAVGKSLVVYSKVEIASSDVYILLIVVDTANCSHDVLRIKVNEAGHDREFKYGNKGYFILPEDGNDTFNLFVWAPYLCDGGICKVTLKRPGLVIDLPIVGKTFVQYNGTGHWRLLPIDSHNSTKGYRYLWHFEEGRQKTPTKISTLNSEGRVLKTMDTNLQLNSKIEAYSTAYGNLGFCAFSSNIPPTCTLSDSSLVRRINFDNIKAERERSFYVEIVNTKDQGFLLTTYPCRGYSLKLCQMSYVKITRIDADGTIGNEVSYKFNEGEQIFKTFLEDFNEYGEYCKYFLKANYVKINSRKGVEWEYDGEVILASCMANI